jgi:hypothetical protein
MRARVGIVLGLTLGLFSAARADAQGIPVVGGPGNLSQRFAEAMLEQLVRQYPLRVASELHGPRYERFLAAARRYVRDPVWRGPESGSGAQDLWVVLSSGPSEETR